VDPSLYETFARVAQTHWWFEGRRAVLREVMRRHLGARRDLRLLDVGAGTFANLPMLEEFGSVTGLEASAEAIAIARVQLGESRVHAILGELPAGVPADRRFDVVTAIDVLEHLEHPVESLRAVRAALEPEGWLFATVPAWEFLWTVHDDTNHHFRRYTPALLREQLEAGGFRVAWWSGYNALLFPAVAAVRLAQKALKLEARGGSDLDEVKEPLNSVLRAVFSAERFVVPRVTLPFGVSLVAAARPA
jgi:SAM-dependent methyltransferase